MDLTPDDVRRWVRLLDLPVSDAQPENLLVAHQVLPHQLNLIDGLKHAVLVLEREEGKPKILLLAIVLNLLDLYIALLDNLVEQCFSINFSLVHHELGANLDQFSLALWVVVIGFLDFLQLLD